MRINRLYLENHLPILSGMGKESVELNLYNVNYLINIFIGRMGSGKTYILSHLQPFASVGTLDSRSQDDLIIEGKDGKKIIEYQKGLDDYVIRHDYIWNDKIGKHTTRSYIEKNGTEMNANGNQGSFQTIIYYEFGIEPNFLRLLRLGPNVINFINMSTTERKNFISTLLANTEIYTFLNKKWSEELRSVNAQLGVLGNKLNHIGSNDVGKLNDELESNLDDLVDANSDYDRIMKRAYSLEAENESLLDHRSVNDALIIKNQLASDVSSIHLECQDLKDKINFYDNMHDLNEINRIIGGLDVKLVNVNEQLNRLENSHKEKSRSLNELNDRKAMTSNIDHMETLELTYNDLLEKDRIFQRELSGFKCDYTSTFLTGFIGDLHTIDILINDISQYDPEIVKKIYNSDSTILRWAQQQVDIIGAKKFKIQKMINTLKFSERYEAPSTLYRPPFCPTDTCPFYKLHPYTLQKGHKEKDSFSDDLRKYQNELNDLDVQSYKLADYSIIYSKIVNLKELWKKSFHILSSLNSLNSTSLLQVLTNLESRTWYNYDKLIQVLENATKREKYYELTENLNRIKAELNTIKLSQNTNIDSEIDRLYIEIHGIESEIEQNEKDRNDVTADIQRYNKIYLELSQLSIFKDQYSKLGNEYTVKSDQLDKLEKNILVVKDNMGVLSNLSMEGIQLKSKIQKLSERNDAIKTVLNDIAYTKTEYDKVLQEKKYLEYLTKATSAKEGIPLVMVEMFLNSCREFINELITTVSDDDFEILKFKIDESTFEIPYYVNGQKVDDISKASQGQVSIASTAISFALAAQSLFDYNIPLLDEVDSSLYKSNRDKSISMIMRQLTAIHSEQAFLITHNNTYEGQPINIIMTTDEVVNNSYGCNIMRVYQ